MTRKMQSGKILILVAVALALFAVLQIAESKSVDEEAKAIEKHVDDEFKKLSKRAADDEDDGGKRRKSKKKKTTTTAAPSDMSMSTTAGPGGASGSTKKSGSTASPSSSSPTTGHPDDPKGSTTASPKGGSTTTSKTDPIKQDEDRVKKAREKQSQERNIIRKIFEQTINWKKWLEDNGRKTLNPKAAKATWELAEKVKQLITKPTRFYGKFNSAW